LLYVLLPEYLDILCNESQLDVPFILNLFRQTTSTCFGRIYCPSSEGKKKVSNPITGLWGPEGYGRLRLPDSVTSALEGGRLSAISTGRIYLQEYPGTHFKRLSRPRAYGIV
jgi:hypothetical protein